VAKFFSNGIVQVREVFCRLSWGVEKMEAWGKGTKLIQMSWSAYAGTTVWVY